MLSIFFDFFDFGILLFLLGFMMAAYVAAGSYRLGAAVVRHAVLEVGLVGVMIGTVSLLGNMADPDMIPVDTFGVLIVAVYSLIIFGITSIIGSEENQTSSPSKARTLIGCSIFLVSVGFAIADTGLSAYISPLSIILVASGAGLVAGLSKITNQVDVFGNVVRCLPFLGLFYLFMFSISLLTVLDDPRSLGPRLAVAYLSFGYALLSSVIIKLLRPSIVNEYKPIDWSFVGWSLVILLGTFGGLLASFAD